MDHYGILTNELGKYDPGLLDKPHLVAGNKLDLEGTQENFQELESALSAEEVFGISIHGRIGIDPLVNRMFSFLEL